MKKLLVVLFVWTLFVNAGNAAEISMSQNEMSFTQGHLQVGPSLAVLNGVTGFGAGVSLNFPVIDRLFVGVESGFYRWSNSVAGLASASTTSIPILANAQYFIPTGYAGINPYVGLSVGPALVFQSLTNVLGSSLSDSSLFFNLHFRPGIEFVVSRNVGIYVEPRLGILDSSFVFVPQAGLGVAL